MKNIHVLPTDKPTGIFKLNDSLLFSIINKVRSNNEGFHLYITSDEEIKEGDFVIHIGNPYFQFKEYMREFLCKDCKKIILTTDQDLIKDGVQAIDDEFLEWFVKNPSCEFAHLGFTSIIGDLETKRTYKIIIPKEEPKQDFPMQKLIDIMENDEELRPKQETLEEAAEIFVKNRFTKQICNDESYPDIYASKAAIVESHILFAKWQQEQDNKLYSEEEVYDIVDKTIEKFYKHIYSDKTKAEMKDIWFEQFKKK